MWITFLHCSVRDFNEAKPSNSSNAGDAVMAVMSCEPADIASAQRSADEMYQRYRSETTCLKCPHNQHHDYPIMDGYITASYCDIDGQWLSPDLYRSTIAEMGCEP